MMDVKVFIVSTLLFSSLVYCKEEECLSVQRHTFELKDGANFSFSADIKENTGIIIDILFFEKEENDRIKLSKEESWRDIHNGENYAKTDLNYKLKEGWQRIDVFVETSTVTFICLSSKPSPLTISMDQRVKKITVSSKSIKICEESCDIKKYIEKNIDNEEKFIITAFTTTRYPIKFEISKLVESDQFGYIEIKPGYCIWKLNNSSGGIPCAHILHGWNALNIFVNSTTLAINNHIIPVNVSLRTFNISGDYLVNCTKGTPEWEISKQNISIPIYMGQEIVLSLTSKNSFSPVLEFDGNRWSLNWNSGLLFKFGSSWTPLQPNMYKIIFKATSRRVILYNKDKEDVLLDMKIEKIPEVIWVSCVKGTFKLSLSTSHLSTLPVTKTSALPISAPSCAPSYVTILSYIFSLVGMGIIVIVTVRKIIKRRKEIFKRTAQFLRWSNNRYSQPTTTTHLEFTNKINVCEEGESLLPIENQESIKDTIRSSFTETHGKTNPQMSPHNKEVCKIKLKSDKKNDCVKMIGELEPKKETKTILVVGQTGSGKSSFINAMVNNIYGVEYEDSFRFKLIDDMDITGDPYDSGIQYTDKIMAYYIPHMDGIKLDCNYLFIDTPGFGSTCDIDEHKKWNEKFYDFLKKSNVGEVDAICFVIKANYTRLTLAQEYIINSLFSIFGKDIKNNIYTVVSYSDGSDTGVPALLQKSGLDFKFALKFNSIGIYNDGEIDSDSFKVVHNYFLKKWELNMEDIKRFFEKLKQSSPVCLTLTNIVLEEYKDIEKLKDELLELSTLNNDITGEKMQEIQSRIEQNRQLLEMKLNDAQKLSERLNDIPLIKENHLVVNDYINVLIKDEEDKTRISELQKLKERNTNFHNILKEKSTTKSLMDIFLPSKTEKTD